jgi:hypothetical protein
MTFQLTTPVAFLIFNRPDTTQQVFNTIRQAKPQQLLVVADGPRVDFSDEAEKCTETRSIVEQIDWDCKVYRNYSDINLGCKQRVASGLDWVFEQVEEAIILEDDCLPHPTFFRFCDELLQLYRNNSRIMNILGSNFVLNQKQKSKSYYFSRYTNAWGWATWRRAWQFYDIDMKQWPMIQERALFDEFLGNKQAIKYWTKIFHAVYNNQIDTWDYQWTMACWLQNGLSIFPSTNLISNIGFSSQATHTTEKNCKFDSMPIQPMLFPMQHPDCIIRSEDLDDFIERNLFSQTIPKRAIAKIKNMFGLAYY